MLNISSKSASHTIDDRCRDWRSRTILVTPVTLYTRSKQLIYDKGHDKTRQCI